MEGDGPHNKSIIIIIFSLYLQFEFKIHGVKTDIPKLVIVIFTNM